MKTLAEFFGGFLYSAAVASTATVVLLWWVAALSPAPWQVVVLFNRAGEALAEGFVFNTALVGQVLYGLLWMRRNKR